MATIDLRAQVASAVRGEWPAFSAAHPKLAAVLDETLLVEGAVASLAEDPEYQQTMASAEAIGAGAECVATLISRLVSQWLQRLV
jgi:hypothetical protein